MMRRLIVIVVGLLVASPAFAQVEVVAKYRASFPTPLSADQKVTLLRAVAAEVHGGLLVKHEGNTCNGYACDVICFSASALFDVLQDQDNAAIPAWNATTNPRGYACELVTGAPVVDPPPVVTPPPLSVDLSPVLEKLAELEAADRADQAALLAKLDDLAAKVDEPGWFKTVFANPYVQIALTAVGTYFTTHAALK